MDKYEYKVRADEIKALIAEGEFAEAVKIADTIDWRRVKSVMMLCTISDLYKINRRYQESKDILLLAYEKHPTGRLIVYSLCELSIKMEEYVQAIEYYKEFVQIAPKDTGRYILQYRLYEAQDVSLEERIAVLEEFKKRDYREKWAYELAYLYHRIGLSTKCVEECDEMFLWFGEGKYVVKALELKKLHEPLNADQQDKYDMWMQAKEAEGEPYEEEPEDDGYADGAPENTGRLTVDRYADQAAGAETSEAEVLTTELPEVKTVDLGQYNTINLQRALAESMREIMNEEDVSGEEPAEAVAEEFYGQEESAGTPGYDQAGYGEDGGTSGAGFTAYEEPEEEPSTEYREAVAEDTEAGAWPAASMETEEEPEAAENEFVEAEEAEAVPAEMRREAETLESVQEPEEASAVSVEEEPEKPVSTEAQSRSVQENVIAGADHTPPEATIRLPDPREVEKKLKETTVTKFPQKAPASEPPTSRKPTMDTDHLQEISAQIVREDTAAFDAQQILEQMKQEAYRNAEEVDESRIPGARTGVLTPLNTKPSKYDNILSQEYDGQISLVMPEEEQIEKQITGQLSIEDIMAEWEEMKKTNEQKRMEDVRQRILQHTGDLFANFDEATKNGLLEELERAFVAAIMKESGKKPAVKKVVLPEDDIEKKASEPLEEVAAAKSGIETVKEPEAAEEAVSEENVEAGLQEFDEGSEAETDDVPEEEQQETEGFRERELTEEERELFGEFIHHRKSERQLVRTLDNMSLSPYTGNVLITGDEEETTLTLAKALIREMQLNDNNFSGKVAKISAAVLNKKDVEEIFSKLDNGALIIEKAPRLKTETVEKIVKALDKDNKGLLVMMTGQKQDINELLAESPALNTYFNLRVDIEPLDDEALVAYARQYAEEMEYSIDEFGILALHTRIADRQTSDHEVNMAEVRELVDEAIYHANKKTPGHFMDILLAKRYDEDDMIILREKDFMHY